MGFIISLLVSFLDPLNLCGGILSGALMYKFSPNKEVSGLLSIFLVFIMFIIVWNLSQSLGDTTSTLRLLASSLPIGIIAYSTYFFAKRRGSKKSGS